MAKVTKRAVDALQPGAVIWEHGFGVRANRDGTKSYLLDYRVGRRKRRYTIGTHGAPWTVETARKQARALLHEISTGVDPLAAKLATRTAPTVRELAERFMTEHVIKRKPSTQRTYRGYLANHVLPALGPLAVADVTRDDLATLHHALRATPAHANRVLMMCSKLFALAERRWRIRPDGSNPARHIEKYPERLRERYLSEEEFRRLGAALATAATEPVLVPGETTPRRLSPPALAALALLVYLGARRSEILTLQWAHVDLERGVLRLPEHKTDRHGAKTIALNAPAVAILEALPRVQDNPYVIVGARTGRHLVNVTETWYAVRALAGLKDVRLHDLRHSVASVGAAAGLSLLQIGGLLGHRAAQTTKRYAHLSADPMKQAAELVGAKIATAMHGAKRR